MSEPAAAQNMQLSWPDQVILSLCFPADSVFIVERLFLLNLRA